MSTTDPARPKESPTGAAVVPASRFPHGYVSVRSLSDGGVPTLAAVADPDLPVTVSRHCDRVEAVPPSHELGAYADALLDLAERPDVRTIVPHRPQDPYVLAKHRDAFRAHVDLVVPSAATLRRVHDRERLFAAARDADVPIPETRSLEDATDWTADRIVKSRYNILTADYHDGVDRGDSEIVKSITFVPAGDDLDPTAIRAEMGHDPIVQEHVDGDGEYVFAALYDHGEPVATFQHRQLRGDSWTGGGGAYRESVAVPELEAAGRAILDHLEWHGLACLEYVRDATSGEFKLLEINPRMWQSLGTAAAAGAAFPYWYWQVATGRREEVEPGYDSGVRTHYLYGELEHLVSVRRKDSPFGDRPSLAGRAGEIARAVLTDPAFDLVRADDPAPAVQLARNEVRTLLDRHLGLDSPSRANRAHTGCQRTADR